MLRAAHGVMNTALMDYPVVHGPFAKVGETAPFDGDEVCRVLREAIEVLRDRQEDLRQASKLVSTAPLKNELMAYSGQRALFVRELQGIERACGLNKVDETGTVAGALHRAWVSLKTTITNRSNKSILTGMAEGERAAADFYADILATHGSLPSQVSQCLSRQCAELQKSQFELSRKTADCTD
jgi:uncharacterized protein (TIGR02284 family)